MKQPKNNPRNRTSPHCARVLCVSEGCKLSQISKNNREREVTDLIDHPLQSFWEDPFLSTAPIFYGQRWTLSIMVKRYIYE